MLFPSSLVKHGLTDAPSLLMEYRFQVARVAPFIDSSASYERPTLFSFLRPASLPPSFPSSLVLCLASSFLPCLTSSALPRFRPPSRRPSRPSSHLPSRFGSSCKASSWYQVRHFHLISSIRCPLVSYSVNHSLENTHTRNHRRNYFHSISVCTCLLYTSPSPRD